MGSAPSNPQQKQPRTIPPRRGQITAQIFESVFETLNSVAREALGWMSDGGDGVNGGENGGGDGVNGGENGGGGGDEKYEGLDICNL
nr:Junctophilin-1 like [Ipomoea batatas]GME11603.1 Junctophilin-1 like [Ipomoea batatas]